MKLRIKDNSLRYRISQSDLATLTKTGRIEKTIYFTPDEKSRLTYALEHQACSDCAVLRYRPPDITVVISTDELLRWGQSEQVGIYSKADLGSHGDLDIVVEKDYGCIDDSNAENEDTFPNPKACAS